MSIGFGGAAANLTEGTDHSAASLAPRGRGVRDVVFLALLYLSLLVGLLTLLILVIDVAVDGWPRLNLDLLTEYSASRPLRAGARAALLGSIWVIGVTAAVCLPLGIAAAIYLEEYADHTKWWNRVIELNIQNLAAVPSIVYGILGLAFLVRGRLSLGPTVLAGGLTLAMLVLPVVIIASREALRAVPSTIRDASLALGASRWQTTWRQVLPSAIPGIATGAILALSRALGEAAPLLVVSGIVFIQFSPTSLDSQFTVLPLQIFNWVSQPQEGFRILAAAAIVLMLALLLSMNSLAIYIRNRYSRKW